MKYTLQDTVRDIMLTRTNEPEDDWFTLEELKAKVRERDPDRSILSEASLSARLRALRAVGYRLDKRVLAADGSARIWQYRLSLRERGCA